MIRRLLVLPAFVALALPGCAALPDRIAGTNYDAASPPYIAASLEQLATEPSLPQRADLVHRVLLVGDAGVPRASEPVLESVHAWGNAHPEQTTVLYLGDNVYPSGLEADDLARGEAVLKAQLDASSARKIFVPGNHDWGFPYQGRDRIVRQQEYLESNGAAFLPRDGCPGPTYRELVAAEQSDSRGLGLILIDIDPWFVEKSSRANCPGVETPEQLGDQLAALLAQHRGEWLIVAAHHPLRTGGPHGGYTRGMFADFITGSMLLVFGSLQDSYEEGYRAIMRPIEAALAGAPPLLFAAGHDHNLQVLEGGEHANFQIVSGAGATDRVRGGHVTNIEGTLFAHGHPGFIALDLVRSGDVERAFVHVVETGKPLPVFDLDLGTPAEN